jgi:hypothetical protein
VKRPAEAFMPLDPVPPDNVGVTYCSPSVPSSFDSVERGIGQDERRAQRA